MKKITLMIVCLFGYMSYGQVNIDENFDSGTPTDWTGTYSNTAESACAGNSERDNIYSTSATGNLTSPNMVMGSNGTDLNISFDYVILDYPAGFDPPSDATPAGWGSAELQYSTDDGANWTTILTIDDLNHVVSNTCATMMATIPAASLPDMSDVKLQIINTWAAGDYYFYIDNFVAQQDLGCVAGVIDTITPIDDCGNGQFTIDVVVTTANNAIQLNDGTNTYAISGDGVTVTAGPYPTGTSVTLSVEHSVAACDFDLAEQQYFCPPTNDDAANAIPLILDEGTMCGPNTITGITNIGTTDSGIAEPSCGAYGTPADRGDLWYSFVAPASGQLTLNTTNLSGLTSVAGAYYSGAVGSLVEEDCTEFGTGWPWEISGLTSGETYYLRAWDYGNDDFGSFDLCGYYLTCAQGEANAVISDIDCVTNTYNITVTFSNVADATQVNDGTNVYVISGSTAVAGPYAFGTSTTLTIEHSNVACDFDLGTYGLDACPPTNDDCSGAIALTPGGVYNDNAIDGTVIAATGDAEDIDNCGEPGPGVWYSVVVPAGGDITIETGPDAATAVTTFDSVIEVFEGSCGSLTSIECDDDDAATGNFSLISLTGRTPGETLFIRVWEYNGDEEELFSISAYSATLGIDELEDNTTLTYYPNPVKNTLMLNAQNTIENVTIFNMLGQEVLRTVPNNVDSELDMSSLQTGTYFVKVTIANVTKTIRVIKQ